MVEERFTNFSLLPNRLKRVFEKKPTTPSFTRADAIERFKLVAASGPEGQEPVHSFEEGSVVVLNQFPPGTILREKAENEGKTEYHWWCIGSYDSERKQVTAYDASAPRMDYRSSVLSQSPNLGAITRRANSQNEKGDIDFKVGAKGMLVDLFLSHEAKYAVHPFWSKLPEKRHTVKIDVIEYGTKVKKKKEKRSAPPLRQLVPSPSGVGV